MLVPVVPTVDVESTLPPPVWAFRALVRRVDRGGNRMLSPRLEVVSPKRRFFVIPFVKCPPPPPPGAAGVVAVDVKGAPPTFRF